MSSELWAFDYDVNTPFCKTQCTIVYKGKDASDVDPPTTNLSEIIEELVIWASYPFGLGITDLEWDEGDKKSTKWIFDNERQIIQGMSSHHPTWYFDT
jgi:hypothetical protein